MRDTEKERLREKQAPCREPDVGLHPGSPGSRPGRKAALNPSATQAAGIIITNSSQASCFLQANLTATLREISALHSMDREKVLRE